MTDKFTKPILKNVREIFDESLKRYVNEMYDNKFEFQLGNCSFSEDQAKFQLIVTFKGTTPQDIQRKKEYEDLQQMAKFFDIDLLKKHPRYTLVGYKSKARTKPWIITDNQRSGEFIITDDQAKTLFGKKDVNEFIERQREAQSNA
jgi:hypothetical protein